MSYSNAKRGNFVETYHGKANIKRQSFLEYTFDSDSEKNVNKRSLYRRDHGDCALLFFISPLLYV
mgnify:CR=1 FL=1